MAIASGVFGDEQWKSIPEIPTNRRTQFYVLHDDGSYKYGYDTGKDGSYAKQKSSAANQVEGYYGYPNVEGNIVNVKYTAGVQGFVPENVQSSSGQSKVWSASSQSQHQAPAIVKQSSYSNDNSDASYSLSYNTGDHSRTESSDASGNVQGSYSYTNEAGNHDLTYVAGAKTGFQVTGGSLSVPNGLLNAGDTKSSSSSQASGSSWQQKQGSNSQSSSWDSSSNEPATDGSYSFSYNAGDHSRKESADAAGNVQGQYAYTNEAGNHDLSYVAGAKTGFQVTGGSLSVPNGLVGKNLNVKSSYGKAESSYSGSSNAHSGHASQVDDGSCKFSYNAGDHSRNEAADASGNVQGSYSYQSESGNKDLHYKAGQEGFIVTGGNLAPKTDLLNSLESSPAGNSDDGSYKFAIHGDNFNRVEESDKSGKVRGQYSHKSQFGHSSVSYGSKSENNFQSSHQFQVKPPTQYLPPTISTYKTNKLTNNDALVQTYLPPVHSHKYGYIYDTKH